MGDFCQGNSSSFPLSSGSHGIHLPFSNFSIAGLPARWGRYPLGVPFVRPKGTKTRLGRSPLRTSLGYEAGHASRLQSARLSCCGSWYCHHTRPPWAAGPMARQFPRPGLPWHSGVPAAGSQTPGACQIPASIEIRAASAAHLNSSFFIALDLSPVPPRHPILLHQIPPAALCRQG